ncbi:MAG: RidA family protein [Nitrospirae bacterium]|nr:MAG: RidA family protein [Nitrospirota bacterium]
MDPEEKLAGLGITLPDLPKPLGAYVPCVQSGNLLFISGMLPLKDGKLMCTGKAGPEVSVEDAQACARQSAINALAVVKAHCGSLLKIRRCVKLNGFIASAPDFTDQPKVLNGASEFLLEVLGEKGLHARAAIGAAVLPLNATVEIDFIFEIED